jgi:hypothetical protein
MKSGKHWPGETEESHAELVRIVGTRVILTEVLRGFPRRIHTNCIVEGSGLRLGTLVCQWQVIHVALFGTDLGSFVTVCEEFM